MTLYKVEEYSGKGRRKLLLFPSLPAMVLCGFLLSLGGGGKDSVSFMFITVGQSLPGEG